VTHRPYRIAYLVSHPIQYQAPLLRHIAADPSVDLTVFFLGDISLKAHDDPGFGRLVHWDVPLLGGYKHSFLRGLGRHRVPSFWWPFVAPPLMRLRNFDVVWLHGYAHHALLSTLMMAKMLGVKVFLRGESHLTSERRSGMKTRIKNSRMPAFFRTVDAFLAIGTLNEQYYLHYRVPHDRIFRVPYAVDNQFFGTKADEAESSRDQLRRELGLDGARPVILYASKLQRRKRPHDLLSAYTALSPDNYHEPRPYLIFVGDGEDRSALEAVAARTSWSSIKFVGFKNQTELPRYYNLCDVFVLPSEYEPWGLVVNEVMNAGKPVIVSDQVGSAPDLVADGKNGFIVPVGDVRRLEQCLRLLTESGELVRQMGQESRRRIQNYSFEADLLGLKTALRTVVPLNTH
jgi:glycosyltransferase involved in cell wall biosynthesis